MLITLRSPSRSRPRLRAATTVACLLLLAGCSEDKPEQQPKAEPTTSSPTATALSDYDTGAITLARDEFCDRVDQESLATVLGSDPTEAKSWRPGDRLPGTKEVSNEFGCAWTGGQVTARAWVFAPPTTAARAGDFAAETVGSKCRRLESAPELGTPGVAQTCDLNAGVALVGFYGLVGDAWVGCEVSGTDDASRVGEWCVGVLEAMRAT